MTIKEIIDGLKFTVDMFLFDPITGETFTEPRNDMDKTTIDACKGAIELLEELLEQEPCEDTISRKAVLDLFNKSDGYSWEMSLLKNKIEQLPPVTPQPKWIPVSERLPESFRFVNCTCHSLIDDREDWVVETCYLTQPKDSPYSDWGNIPMLNAGDCEVVAWMYRDIPEPYKAESEDKK